MADFDPAAFAAGKDDEKPFDPAAFAAGAPAQKASFLSEAGGRIADTARGLKDAAVHGSLPSSGADLKERLTRLGGALAHPFKEAGLAVADEAKHPLRTLQGAPLARALGYSTPEAVAHHDAESREVVRGLQGNIPLAGLAHEHLTGFPEESAADAAEAPHAKGVGTVAGGAALALAPKVVPLIGRGLTDAANATQDALAAASEASVARSAARSAASGGVKETLKNVAKETGKEAASHGLHKTVAASLAHQLPGGHYLAPIVAAATVAKPVAKAAATVADEAFAGLARRAGVGAKVLDPKLAARIAEAEAALKTATPDQAEILKSSIAGMKKRAAAGPRPAPAAPEPGNAPVAAEYEPPPRVDIDEEPATYQAEGRPTSALEGAPERRALAPIEEHDVAPEQIVGESATPASARPGAAERRPIESSGRREPAAARRPIATTGYQAAVDRLARLAKKTDSRSDFVRDAVQGGMDARDARKIWRAAHPFKPAARGTLAEGETP